MGARRRRRNFSRKKAAVPERCGGLFRSLSTVLLGVAQKIFQRNMNFTMLFFILGDPNLNHSFNFHIDGSPLLTGDYFHFSQSEFHQAAMDRGFVALP